MRETSDEQFLEVSGRDQSARETLTFGAELERHSRRGNIQSTQDVGHHKPHEIDTRIGLRLVTQLLGPEASDEHRAIVVVLANRETCVLGWITNVRSVHGNASLDQRNTKIPANTRGWSKSLEIVDCGLSLAE